MTTWDVRAVRWEHGWELHIKDIGVTQSRTLAGAERMVRDYVESLTGNATAGDVVVVRPDLDGLEAEAIAARQRTGQAPQETREAAAAARAVARRLRAVGLSVSDTAAVLGVSRGRVSQLVGEDAA